MKRKNKYNQYFCGVKNYILLNEINVFLVMASHFFFIDAILDFNQFQKL